MWALEAGESAFRPEIDQPGPRLRPRAQPNPADGLPQATEITIAEPPAARPGGMGGPAAGTRMEP